MKNYTTIRVRGSEHVLWCWFGVSTKDL